MGDLRLGVQGDHARLPMRLQGLARRLIVSGTPHQGVEAVAAGGEAVPGQVPPELGHQQLVAPLLHRRQVDIDAPLDVVGDVTLPPQVARPAVEDHRADQRVQVAVAPVGPLGGGREPEAVGGCDLADDAAVLGRR